MAVYEQTAAAAAEICEKAHLKPGSILVVGCSTSEVVGARIGARMVLGRGAGFVRAVIFVVVVAMAAKLAFDQFAGPIG